MRRQVLFSGDHHFHEHTRFAECVRVHNWMVEIAREHAVDAFVSTGDVYESASSPLERQAAGEWVMAMADVCPVGIAKGNHDRPLDCQILGKLRTRHPVIVEERAGVHVVAGVALALVAWPERSRMLAALGSQSAADEAVQEALRAVLRSLGDELGDHAGPRVLAGHFMCDGAETSTGQPLLGQPIRVGLTDLALARAHLVVMGHIHKFQQWDCMGVPALYTGSPFRTTFGQLEQKSVTLAEFDGGALVGLRQIQTPATKMVQLEGRFADGAMEIAS